VGRSGQHSQERPARGATPVDLVSVSRGTLRASELSGLLRASATWRVYEFRQGRSSPQGASGTSAQAWRSANLDA